MSFGELGVGGGWCIWIIKSALVPFWDSIWDLSLSLRCLRPGTRAWQLKIKNDAIVKKPIKKNFQAVHKSCRWLLETNLKTIVGPTTEFHNTCLFIKRKILYVNLTGWFINSWRFPFYKTIVPKGGLCSESHLKITIRTEINSFVKLIHPLI